MAVGGVNAVWIESIHVVGQSIGVEEEEEEEEEEEGWFVFGFLIPSHCCIHGAFRLCDLVHLFISFFPFNQTWISHIHTSRSCDDRSLIDIYLA
jgi:hypothetical protein